MMTASDRRAAGGVPFLPLSPGVTPNSAKGFVWRRQAGWGYPGVAIVRGPFYVEAFQAYVAGLISQQSFVSGPITIQSFVAGVVAFEGTPE